MLCAGQTFELVWHFYRITQRIIFPYFYRGETKFVSGSKFFFDFEFCWDNSEKHKFWPKNGIPGPGILLLRKPKFWRWATLRLDRGNYQEIIESLQADKSRDSNVQQICVSPQEELG